MAKEILPKIAFINNAKTYKLLANEKRLEILNNIKFEEKRVEQLVKILGVSKANVSQHLALLRHAGIVTARRDGLNVYYKIVDPEIIKDSFARDISTITLSYTFFRAEDQSKARVAQANVPYSN